MAKAIQRDPYAGMNGTERRRAMELDAKQRAGLIREWAFEAESLKLADGSWYTPDFRVIHLDQTVEFEETKGHWREAARVRIKVAADRHPYRFTALKQRKGGGWDVEVFGERSAA